MSDRWFYRVFGQEFGPVSLDLVRTLVAAGTIAPDDEVRDAGRSNWILACAASELRESIKSPTTALAVERRAVRDEWFCRGATGDYGPLSLSDLIQLAALGELKPDEDVKTKADDYWKQVRSIQRLVELLPFSEQSHNPSDATCLSIFAENEPPLAQDRSPESFADFQHAINCCVLNELAVDHDSDEEVKILPFPGVQSTRSNTELTNSFTATLDLESLLAGLGGFEASSVLQETDDRTNDSTTCLDACEDPSQRTNSLPIPIPSHDARENPLTLTLSPQGLGEGTCESSDFVAVASSHSTGAGSSSHVETTNQPVFFDEESFTAMPIAESDSVTGVRLSEAFKARFRKPQRTSILKRPFSDLETISAGVILGLGLLMVVEWLAR